MKASGHSEPPSKKEYIKGRQSTAATPQQNHAALYLRVSTPDQKPDLQYDGLRAYAERDEAEWQRLETRQAEQRAYAAQTRAFFNDLDKRHFRVEARKLHQEITNTRTNLTARDSQTSRDRKPRRYRDDDDGRERGGEANGKRLGP